MRQGRYGGFNINMESEINQLQAECSKWNKEIAIMMEENTGLKNSLAQILQAKPAKINLPDIENFQNEFIRKDELISLLRNDIAELNSLLEEKTGNEKPLNKISASLDELGKIISRARMEFDSLKMEFNFYSMKMDMDSTRKDV